MRHRVLMVLTIAFGALVQLGLPFWPLLGGLKPPILAAMTLHYALRKNKEDIVLAISISALLQDGLEMGSFGPALLAFPILGIGAYRIRNEIFCDGLITQLILGAVMGLFITLTTLLVYTVTAQRSINPVLASVRLLSSVGLGMATLPLVSRLLNELESLLPKRKRYGWQ